jgi:hypothetical protein
MRKILNITLFVILAGLLMMPVYVSAQEKTDNPGSAKPKKTDETPKKTEETSKKTVEPDDQTSDEGITFPEIEGWEKGGIRTYPNAALGYSVAYQSEEGGTITVYVYNGGLKKIPDDINDKILIDEIERAKNEIVQIGKMGVYENVKELKNDRVTLGGANGKVKALRSLYYFKVRGNEVDSEIYLFSYKNNFIKIRSTRPKSEEGKENKAVMNLLAEIDKLFAK